MEDKDTTRELDNPQEEKKIKKAVNDISTDLSSLCVDVKSISGQLPSLVVTRVPEATSDMRLTYAVQHIVAGALVVRLGVVLRLNKHRHLAPIARYTAWGVV